MFRHHSRTAAVVLAVAAAATTVTGCGSSASTSRTVVIATHDSWAMPRSVLAQFTRRTGYTVRIEEEGDAGELTNKLVLTKGDPIADGVYGIDNTFATRATGAGIIAPYTPANLPASAQRYLLPGTAGHELTPTDYSDVCVNVDDSWFASHHLARPRTFADLVKPEYKNLLVTPAATTSSTGLAFLAATIAAEGSHWQAYWRALLANGAKVDPGWTEAWETDYTDGGGHGSRPIVVSYSSSPPDTIAKGASTPTTSAVLGTCFRQIEYVGVLQGAANPAGAQAFVRFMVSKQAQETMPDNMYVYPVNKAAKLPADWARFAPIAPKPWSLPASEITARRSAWLREWRDLVSG